MDERAKVPVTLPPENPTPAFWQDPPATIADLRSTAELPESADVVIVGSGITGAAVAWNLLADKDGPPASVVMLEARQASSGATGRNGKVPEAEEGAHRTESLMRDRGPHQSCLVPLLPRPRR